MTSGLLSRFAAVVFALLALQPALAAQEAPDALVRRLSGEVLNDLRADPALKSGNIEHIIALVDKSVMPNVNFRRMTAAAVGPAWRRATGSSTKAGDTCRSRRACRKVSRPC